MTPSPRVHALRRPETPPTTRTGDEGQGAAGESSPDSSSSGGGGGGGGRRTRPRVEEEREGEWEDEQQHEQDEQQQQHGGGSDPGLGEQFGLPLEIARDHVLPYLDGLTLAQWGRASQTTRAQVECDDGVLWKTAVHKEFGWLSHRKPSYLTFPDFYGHLRRATGPLVGVDPSPRGDNIWDPLHQWRPGRLVCVGGSLYRPHTLKNVDAFPDTGAARVDPGGWPCPFQRLGRPPLNIRRSAVGLVRDWEDGLWVLGGWGGSGQEQQALRSVECWSVESLGEPDGLGVVEAGAEYVIVDSDDDEGTVPGMEEDEDEDEGGEEIDHGAQGRGEGADHDVDDDDGEEGYLEAEPEMEPDGQGEPEGGGGGLWKPQWARNGKWSIRSDMQTPRCFLAATMDPAGGILAIGGGESIWQGAEVYASTELYNSHRDMYGPWIPGPNMAAARCGHAAAVGDNFDIYVVGGYGGGTTYLDSVEVLPGGVMGDDGRGFIPLEGEGASMSVPRTGFALSKGPDRAFYVAGGSPDGIRSHKTAERFDPREGRWQPLPSMITPRGYCSGAFAASGLFYVAGGQATDDLLLPSVECFDPRANRWRLLPASMEQGVGLTRVDLAMAYTLF